MLRPYLFAVVIMNSAALRDAAQSSSVPLEAELVSSMTWLITIRWLAGIGVLGATFVADTFFRVSLPALSLYLLGVIILVYNAAFHLIARRLMRKEPRAHHQSDFFTKTQIGCDWLAMTALIHFSGGLESPAIFYFFFHVVIASILLSMRATFLYAAMAALLISAIGIGEYAGALPHYFVLANASAALYRQPLFVLGTIFFFSSTMFVAAYLASTLNARLRKREAQVVTLSQNLLSAYTRLETVYESAEAVNSTLELTQVLDRLVQRTADALGVRACSIRLLDETGARLNVAAVYGLSDAYVKKGDLTLDQNPLAREVIAGKAIIVNDVATDTRLQYPQQALEEGIASMLSAPLHGKQGPLGLIRAYSVDAYHFTADDAEFVSAIARQGSIAIENALAYQALGKLDQMKSRFVMTVTHELRSPVSVVRSLLRTLLAGYVGELGETQREMLQRVQYRADFLQTLIDDLLDLAAGKADVSAKEEIVPVRLDEAVARVVERFTIPAQEKAIALEWECACADGPIKIAATNEGIDRVLNNLVSNAVKYTPHGGRVAVKLFARANRATLEVADSGIGIPEDALTHLFEEFYRAPNARAQVKEGTGLGLAITKDLIVRYGGHIGVQSQAGRGTTFTVTFPILIELPV
ncbi:MAG: GAF domain-containing protein [Chloroflexi bacterium]|nr:GAF domain-containing protein [Chloroflexota bacterium]